MRALAIGLAVVIGIAADLPVWFIVLAIIVALFARS